MEKYSELNTLNIPYLTACEKEICNFFLKDDSLVLYFKKLNFKIFKNVSVYLKNIKTRELLFAPSKAHNNSLVIDLQDLNKICTNYEYSIVISSEDEFNKILYYPIYKPIDSNDELLTYSSSTNIKWYLRLTNNGKIRLSTIVLFPNTNKS
ncbi:hypothetical protein [Clostridium tertium]|uniref:Uncharacterized protein n=1 Tax=Clostridium tertium TaxID=1559 RepID=A0A6N2YAK7_9CLOT